LEKLFEAPGWFKIVLIWIALCAVALSPFRYLLLQILVGTSYPFQSFSAAFTTLVLAIYIPLVFGLLLLIGMGIPALIIVGVLNARGQELTKARAFAAAVVTPIAFLIGSLLYFLSLPYLAYSTHWLSADNVIRATNGPAQYFYEYVVETMTPLRYPRFVDGVGGLSNLTAKERLRAHVAGVYLGESEVISYVTKAYPDFAREVEQRPSQ
jgi:hypothetical protein